jgi:DMSO/TMAO reductase YedYZ molybdopterin-dependent catalytic subunit
LSGEVQVAEVVDLAVPGEVDQHEIVRVGLRPLTLMLEEIRKRPAQSVAVAMECAGNGPRAFFAASHQPTMVA